MRYARRPASPPRFRLPESGYLAAMGVVSPERERTAPERAPQPPPPEPPRRRPEWPKFPWGLVALGLAIVAVLFAVDRVRDFFGDLFPDFDNPFASETIDRSGPAVLQSIENIGEYRAATGNFEVIVDLHKDTDLPDELLGERTLFIAAGSVDAGVNLAALEEDDVEVGDDRRSVSVTLPRATLFEPELDLARSRVYDRDEGLFNEIAGLFTDDPDYQQELNLLAERKLRQAAQRGSGLVPRAEQNTRAMLESLLASLGFTQVTVRFE
jgi:hypothetical protein